MAWRSGSWSIGVGLLDGRGAELMRVDQELLSIGHADLIENARHVMPDRTVANRQLVGDVFVGESLPHQSDDLAFPLGQGVGPCPAAVGRGPPSS